MIKKDLITCTRHYRDRVNAIKKLIITDDSFFKNVQGYISVTKFQNQGNEHDNFLIWIKNALIYMGKTIV